MEPANPDDRDPMGPPEVPCECFCLHCQRVFMSDGMWLQRVVNSKDGFPGFWMCPTPNCGGAGFTMDIFPTDPNHPANAGWHCSDDEAEQPAVDADEDWDPSESKFEEFDEEEEDNEGEEWKQGIRPDELPIEPPVMTEAQLEQQAAAHRDRDEEEKRYDMPDERPRVIDWADHNDPPPPLGDDAIPF